MTALKGLIQIALKLIENEGQKSVTTKLPDREVTIQGPGADEMIQKAAEILSNHNGDFQITVAEKFLAPPAMSPCRDFCRAKSQ